MASSPQFEPIDLNILPEQYRPRVTSPIIMLLWATSGVLLILLVPGALIFRGTQVRQAREQATALEHANLTLATIRTPLPGIIDLTEELSKTVRALEAIEIVHPTALAPRAEWPRIFGAILTYDEERIRLTELFQDEDDLYLAGLALAEDDVLSYASTLDRSGVFERVIMQSMEGSDEPFVPPVPTAAPTLTGTVATATPGPVATPTTEIGPYDKYEIDDFEPGRISVGEVQWHSFNPAYDVDQAAFLGKAGRRYCIQALPQALGVDTVLEIDAGGTGYANDDCQPGGAVLITCQCPPGTITGTLASVIEVQMGVYDQELRIRVSNRGEYGHDKAYTLLVYEGTGDPWESDDQAPKPIALGETQPRTFYPWGDVDRVSFPVKAGRAYELRTTGLALGVDTLVSVSVNGVLYQDDDADPGDLSSRVQFQAVSDGVANATVTNKGQFGIDMSYTVGLSEVGGDAYELDDYSPRPISPAEQQKHTFFPEGDIDRVEFNIKAGHVYEIKTYSLTVGVDTVLSILASGRAYENDDVGPGDPSSYIVFTAAGDGTAGVTIANREQYSTYHEYWLTLTVLPGTPTPTPAMTATPTGPVPTPTPDCGDVYEPDDLVPRLMAVGGNQAHSFCPPGDVDRIVFTAKSGYAYRIETTGLALGVDTYLSVQIGTTALTNDDHAPQSLASRVEIQNQTDTDLPAFVLVINKGFSGEGMTYNLRVVDLALTEEGDDFEDDLEKTVNIAFGAPQLHNFSPEGDVDRVFFMVEPSRYYEIYTFDLAPGVDTLLDVHITALDPDIEAWLHYTNDDESPGVPSSRIGFRYERPDDGRAEVTIVQKGNYGIDKSYLLQVDVLGDIYERDDVTGMPISVGFPQTRSFDPEGDVDKAHFTAKAHHRYSIYTADLGELVDTVLTVDMGPARLTNDDRMPGDLSSYVELQNDGPNDTQAMVTISNNGQYGPLRGYTVQVDDLGTISGDEYEPDLTIKRHISVNEMQRHTFHPDLDVDRVVLMVKGGRWYSILTCGTGSVSPCWPLAPGVDTVLRVTGPITPCIPHDCLNDDYRTGYLNSRVDFEALVDGEVAITVTNKGLFGPTMTYYLSAHELAAMTATPVSSPPPPYFSPTPTLTQTPRPPFSPTPSPSPYPPPPATPTSSPYPAPATPTGTPGAYPVSLLSPSGEPVLAKEFSALRAPAAFRPLLKPMAQEDSSATSTTVAFVLLLRLRRVTP